MTTALPFCPHCGTPFTTPRRVAAAHRQLPETTSGDRPPQPSTTETEITMTTECPQQHLHTDAPRGYLEWHAFAEAMAATHVQEPCTGGCGGLIWVPTDDLCGGCCFLEGCECAGWSA